MKKYLAFFSIFVFGACGALKNMPDDEFIVGIDAYAAADDKKNCYVLNNQPNVNPNDLKHITFKRYLHNALMLRGYSIAQDSSQADVFISFNYKLNAPQKETRQKEVPVYGITEVETETTTQKIYTNPADSSQVAVVEKTNTKPAYGVTNYTTETYNSIRHNREVHIVALEAAAFKAAKEMRLWQLDITSLGSSDDLHYLMPYMLAAAVPYFGKSSDKRITTTIYDTDSLALKIRK